MKGRISDQPACPTLFPLKIKPICSLICSFTPKLHKELCNYFYSYVTEAPSRQTWTTDLYCKTTPLRCPEWQRGFLNHQSPNKQVKFSYTRKAKDIMNNPLVNISCKCFTTAFILADNSFMKTDDTGKGQALQIRQGRTGYFTWNPPPPQKKGKDYK